MNRHMAPATIATLVLIMAAGCSDGAVPLEEGHNALHVREFDIRSSAIMTDGKGSPVKVRPSGLYDASPLAPADQLLGAFYQRSGVRAARFPLGWGCDLTLDFVFNDEMADAGSSESYNLNAIDGLADELIKYQILPIWQAAWDIGYDGCVKTPTIGVASRPISSPDQWGKVTAFFANRLNSLIRRYYNAEMLARINDSGLFAGYVEVYPDATVSGAYGDLNIIGLLQAYGIFQSNFEEYVPQVPSDGTPSKRVLGIMAPGIVLSSPDDLDDTYSAMNDFIDEFKSNAHLRPDVFSFRPEVDSLASLVDTTLALRAKLDDNDLASVPLAAIGASVTPATWQQLEVFQDTPEKRSMWLGAFAAAGYARLQRQISLITPGRWSTLPAAPGESWSGEDLFQRADGSALPAMFALKAVRDFSNAGSDLISFANQDPVDSPAEISVTGDRGDDVSVLASRLAEGGYQFLVVALPPAAVERNGVNMKYVINVTDVQAGTTGWEVRVAEIEHDSSSYRLISRGPATVDDGNFSFSAYIKGPAVHLIRFSPPGSGDDE